MNKGTNETGPSIMKRGRWFAADWKMANLECSLGFRRIKRTKKGMMSTRNAVFEENRKKKVFGKKGTNSVLRLLVERRSGSHAVCTSNGKGAWGGS